MTYAVEVYPLAVAAIMIYPVGLILTNALLLFCARKAILAERHHAEVARRLPKGAKKSGTAMGSTTLSRATAFLHKEFEVRAKQALPQQVPCPHISVFLTRAVLSRMSSTGK